MSIALVVSLMHGKLNYRNGEKGLPRGNEYIAIAIIGAKTSKEIILNMLYL